MALPTKCTVSAMRELHGSTQSVLLTWGWGAAGKASWRRVHLSGFLEHKQREARQIRG